MAGKERFYEERGYCVVSLGVSYAVLRKALKALKAEGFKVKGFGDMRKEEVSAITGLSIFEAGMAKQRYFDEPFIFEDNTKKIRKLLVEIQAKGFNYAEGRLYHILGDNDKGKAIAILIKLYKKQFGHIITAALGDSPNDIPMLKRVDYPIVIKKPDGKYNSRIRLQKRIKAEGIGPAGWNQAVLKLIKTINI
jgi:mannosyl-3-phosphoglycerate phosphatase